MKPATIPACCALALTAILAAGASHWWSVRQFAGLLRQDLPAGPAPTPAGHPSTPAEAPPTLLAASAADSRHEEAPLAAGQREFYEALIEKMSRVEAQNRDLLDQLAETNRDLMKLEFRVDTHSESFRPMPLVEDKPFSSIDPNPGVLPPRADPAKLPSYE